MQELANRAIRIFFIAFIVVGSFFMLNLIIGVSIDKVIILSPPLTLPACAMLAGSGLTNDAF